MLAAELAEGVAEGEGCPGSWNKTDVETSSLVWVPSWQSITGHPFPLGSMLLPESQTLIQGMFGGGSLCFLWLTCCE